MNFGKNTATNPPAGLAKRALRWGMFIFFLTLGGAWLVAWQSSRWIESRLTKAKFQSLETQAQTLKAFAADPGRSSRGPEFVSEMVSFWMAVPHQEKDHLLVLDLGGRVLHDSAQLDLADMGSQANLVPFSGNPENLGLLTTLQENGRALGWMDLAERKLWGAGKALPGQHLLVLVHQDDALVRAAISKEISLGWQVAALFFLVGLPLAGGVGFFLFKRDVSRAESLGRKRSLEKLSLDEALKGSPVLLWSITMDGLINLRQGDSSGLLNMKPKAMEGRHYQEAFAGHPKVIGLCRQALDGVEVKSTVLIGNHLLDFWMQPYGTREGVTTGVVVSALDVSDRERAEEALQYRLRMETLVAEVSAHFLRQHPRGMEGQVYRTLFDLGRFTGVERSFLVVLDPAKGAVSQCFEWVVEAEDKIMGDFTFKNLRDLPWYQPGPEQLTWNLSTEQDWSNAPPPLRQWAEELGVLSMLCMPLQLGGTIHGFLGLQKTGRSRTWGDEDSSLLRVLGEVITGALKREQEQLSLVRSEELFHAAFNYAPIGVVLINSDGKFVEVNRAICDLLGYSQDELYDIGPMGITPEEFHEEDSEIIGDLLGGRLNFYSAQKQLMAKSGKRVKVNMTAAPVLGPQGRVEGAVAQIQDVTATLAAEESLRKSEEKFKTAFTQAATGVVLSNKDGIYLEVNQTFADLLGYTPEEMRGRSFLDFTHPEDGDVLIWGRENLLQSNIQSYHTKKRYVHRDGHAIWTEVTVGVLRNSEDEPDMFVGHILDVTRREKAEASLHYLVQLENMLTEISAGFIDLPLSKMENGIINALANMGQFLRVDRVQLFQFSRDLSEADNTHEWTAESVPPSQQELQKVDTGLFPRWMAALGRHEVIHIPDVNGLEVDYVQERAYLRSRNIFACLAVPVVSEGVAKGFLVFDVLSRTREWQDEESQILGVIGDVFAQALTRFEAEKKLRQRVRFLDFLAKTSSDFLNMAPGQRGQLIDLTLQRMAAFVGADRAQVFRFEDHHKKALMINEWCRENIPTRIDEIGILNLSQFPYWMDRIGRLQIIDMSSVAEMPEPAAPERKFLQAIGVQSAIGVPMVTRGRAIGWLVLDILHGEHQWSSEEKRFLQVVGDIIAGTLEREEGQLELAKSEERFKSAFNQTLLGMVIISPKGRFLQGNQALADLMGYTVDEIPGLDWSRVTHPDDLARTEQTQKDFLEGNLSSYTDERLIVCRDGLLKWISLGLSPQRTPEGDIRFFIGQMLDITERKEAEMALDEQMLREQMLSEITALFLTVGLEQGQDPILQALSLLGNHTNSDRVHLMDMDLKENSISLHSEWCAADIEPVAHKLGHLDLNHFRPWLETLLHERELMIPDVLQLDDGFAHEKQIMEEIKCRSFLLIPLYRDQSPVGYLSLTTESEAREWPQDWRGFLRIVADVLANVLEREQARNDLVTSEDKWRSLVQNAPEIVVTTDREGRVEFINRPLFGMEPKALIGMKMVDAVLPKYHSQVEELLDRVFEKGEVGRLEVEGLGPKGQMIWYEAHIGPVSLGSNVVSATVLISDISNRKLAEAALQRTKEELEHLVQDRTHDLRDANFRLRQEIQDRRRTEDELFKIRKLESLGVLAGGIAHDFNNMLTSILGNTSLARAQAERLAPEVVARLVSVENAAYQAQALTRQLLTFSKGGAPVRRVLDLAPVVREASGFALRGAGVQVDYDLPGDMPPVEVDEGQVSQAIHNLVLNAQQAMEDRGKILVRVREIQVLPEEELAAVLTPGNYLRITIRDEGPGIPADQVSQIFDPYFTTKQTGLGLGLATSYSIMTRHEGHLGVDSEVGQGTSMHLYFPVSLKPLPKVITPVENLDVPPEGHGRVLVMDDEEGIRSVIGMMLETLGYESSEAADGQKAVDLYKKALDQDDPFYAVIMDLTVPGGMGGREAVQLILAADPEAKVVVSSGYSGDPVLAEHHSFGFVDLLPKPYKIMDLAQVLDRLAKTKLVRD